MRDTQQNVYTSPHVNTIVLSKAGRRVRPVYRLVSCVRLSPPHSAIVSPLCSSLSFADNGIFSSSSVLSDRDTSWVSWNSHLPRGLYIPLDSQANTGVGGPKRRGANLRATNKLALNLLTGRTTHQIFPAHEFTHETGVRPFCAGERADLKHIPLPVTISP